MRRALPSFCAMLLCATFLYNIMGYMVLYTSVRMLLREQTFAKLAMLPDTALTAITVFKTNREFSPGSKSRREIISGGKMYDVVRQKDHGSSITYLCLRDREEENFFRKTKIIDDPSAAPYPFPTTRLILDQIIKSALLSAGKSMDVFACRELLFPRTSLTYIHPVLPVTSPPPQQFC